ncbi:hypothetical protein SLEP1_g28218 [Rubroshorea leprosula]|uniref:Uncharacterized protein n=1 Tax=Rubroshorea leprosula TaxID=152421 RepID=A0AAV5K3V3_9ROSI|nr:hypothetical protein SLEP1_g28218 [Rubroshorea leprosula]
MSSPSQNQGTKMAWLKEVAVADYFKIEVRLKEGRKLRNPEIRTYKFCSSFFSATKQSNLSRIRIGYGFPGNDLDFRGDWDYCIALHQNML